MVSTREQLRRHVLKYSVKQGAFTLKSGASSSWFVDTKQTACRPEGILALADAALEVIGPDITAIGGLTMGGDAEGDRIAGALQAGDKVVITEDTVTRGTSPMEAVRVVREFGAEPVMIVVIVDRGGTCEAMAAAEGVGFHALLTAPDLGFPYVS